MRILNFKAFESYLQSGRHLLYHTVNSYLTFRKILNTDMLKINPAGVTRGPSGVCLSRSINWTNEGMNDFRTVLDSDLLLRNGYRSYPIQEIMYKKNSKIRDSRKDIDRNVWKGNLDWYKSGQRMSPHNIDTLPKDPSMETEFEEEY